MARTRMIKRNPTLDAALRRVSRDARLLRYELITIADDEGRAEADIFKLAERLYPTDGDAIMCLTMWLDQLEREEIIERYWVDGVLYLRIENWHEEQYISHPTPSTLPASPRERSGAAPQRRSSGEIPESSGEIPEKSAKPRKGKEKSSEPRQILDIFSAGDGEEVSPEAARQAAKANLDQGLKRAWDEGDLPTFARLLHLSLRSTEAISSHRSTPPGPVAASGGARIVRDSSGEVIVCDDGMPPNGMLAAPEEGS
jgi:hypothetical protein